MWRNKMINLLESIFNVFLAIILPTEVYLSIVGIMICLDTYFKVGVVRREKEFSWKKLLSGILNKVRIYTPIVLSVYWLDEFPINQIVMNFVNIDHLITRVITGIVIMKEGNSIFSILKDKYNFDIQNEFKKLIKTVKDTKDDINDVM